MEAVSNLRCNKRPAIHLDDEYCPQCIDRYAAQQNYQHNAQNRELTGNVYEQVGTTVTNIDQIGLRKLVHTLKSEQRCLLNCLTLKATHGMRFPKC